MISDEPSARACKLFDFISSPLAASLYQSHPNDLPGDSTVQVDARRNSPEICPEWDCWWQWSGGCEDGWRVLVDINNSIDSFDRSNDNNLKDSDKMKFPRCGVPSDLLHLLNDAKTLSLPRQARNIVELHTPALEISRKGMSPKKYHEVSRMAVYVLDVLNTLLAQHHIEVQHIVDIGAGQGHLSRSLCIAKKLHVLALDSSLHQSEGSTRRFEQLHSKGTLTHRTFWLGEGPAFETHPGLQGTDVEDTRDFETTIDEWISTSSVEGGAQKEPIPVMFLALHACGSLTPSILRKALSHRRNKMLKGQAWYVVAAAAVGCCYNLMRSNDFPLSQTLKCHMEHRSPGFRLSSNHLQLAAQAPAHWFRTPDSESATNLAIKKVLYRALITPLLQSAGKRSDQVEVRKKLGKLNTEAYASFENYLVRAGQKIGIDPLASYRKGIAQNPISTELTPLARRIQTLHALRCLLGPPVESLIILDRCLWLREELKESRTFEVRLVNLFDQEVGSSRNVAIELVPVVE